MGVFYPPESEHAKELAKFESLPTAQCPKPGRPYVYREFPVMCYLAERPAKGGPPVFESRKAESETELANLRSRGWGAGQEEAVTMLTAREADLAVAAAERAFADRKMSEQAQAEAQAADEATDQHLGEIPRTPVRKRGRPRKTA